MGGAKFLGAGVWVGMPCTHSIRNGQKVNGRRPQDVNPASKAPN